MNQSEFEAELRRDGYQVVYNGFAPDTVNAEHSHDWDARLMLLSEITPHPRRQIMVIAVQRKAARCSAI